MLEHQGIVCDMISSQIIQTNSPLASSLKLLRLRYLTMNLHTGLDDTTLAAKVWVAAAVGWASHGLYFIHGEHHLAAPAIFVGAIVLSVLIYGYEYNFGSGSAALNSFAIIGTFNAALFTSMIIYRTMFHPLRSFPGPFGAKVSKLWHSYQILDSKNHVFLHGLYEKYGTIVRTGL